MDRDQVKFIIVHCSATPPAMDIGAAEIDRWHRERGWLGIGYHGVIRRDGKLESGRPLDRPGAHAKGYNYESIGVCLVGGVDDHGQPENNFTPEQFAQLRIILDQLSQRFPNAEILGHRDLPGVAKACPCFNVRAWLTGKLEATE